MDALLDEIIVHDSTFLRFSKNVSYVETELIQSPIKSYNVYNGCHIKFRARRSSPHGETVIRKIKNTGRTGRGFAARVIFYGCADR